MAKLRANGRWNVPGASGAIANGWKVNCYIAGTSTRKDTYTTNDESVANTNPVILDSRGEATIYWSGTYKIVVTDEDDVVVWTEDDYGTGEETTQTGNYNLVLNGSFETDEVTSGEPDNWTIVDYPTGGSGAGVHSLDATDQFHGLNSLKFVSVGDGGGYATSDYFEVQEAKDITVTWAMKSSVVDVRNVVDILWYTAAKTLISTTNLYDDSATNPTSWTAKDAEGTPPATAKYAQLRAYGCHSSDATSGSTWYDSVVGNDIPAATTTARGTVEKATQAEVDTGTDTDRYVTPETFSNSSVLTDLFPSAVAGYDRGKTVNLKDDVGYGVITAVSSFTKNTWESVGPTGSGATNIESTLDIVPLTATHLILTLYVSTEDAAAISYVTLKCRENGSSTDYGLQMGAFTRSFIAAETNNSSRTMTIPLDSSNIFEAEWDSDSPDTREIADLYIIGWVE